MKFTATPAEVREALGLSERAMLALRREGVFRAGTHYRVHGLGRQRPRLRWDPDAAEQALAAASRRILAK